jgi:uncharacterized protein YndB with AHSA1/START domain
MMLPAVIAGVIVCGVSMALLGYVLNSWGQAVWLGVPGAVGCLLGYEFRAIRYAWPIVVLLTIAIVIGTMLTLGLGGAFCALVLIVLAAIPAGVGAAAGAWLRTIMNDRWFVPSRLTIVLALIASLCVWGILEGPAKPGSLETVTTQVTISEPPATVWNALMYYEEVTHPPPWILRVGLARPTATQGWSRKVGETRKCLYNKGWITKRVTQVTSNHSLHFDIVEQHIGYERDVRLTGGSFVLSPTSDGATLLTMTTHYQPLLGPRWGWAWAEHLAVGILHEYVGEGIALKAAHHAQEQQTHRAAR